MPIYYPPAGSGGGGGGGGTGDMLSTNNLSDVADVSESRTNLGLGTASVKNSGDFLQVANNLADLGSASTARTSLGLGTAATQAASAFLQTSNNLSDVTASTARTNLGLGTAAQQNTGAFLQVSNNLSDVTAATARTNLGLGTLAVCGHSGGPGITTAITSDKLVVSAIDHFVSGDGKPYNLAISSMWTTTVSSGNYGLDVTGGTAGQKFHLKLFQDGTGGRTVSWWTGIKWPNDTAPVLSTGIWKADWFTFIQTSSSGWDGFYSGYNYSL